MDIVWLGCRTVGKLLLPARDPGGFILTILMGIAGTLLGGFLDHWLGLSGELTAVLMAIIGSLNMLPLFGMLAARRS
jgi:uncharacterized membrane protein YeaQ/YmgE (transglycosylase-associated protein family)